MYDLQQRAGCFDNLVPLSVLAGYVSTEQQSQVLANKELR